MALCWNIGVPTTREGGGILLSLTLKARSRPHLPGCRAASHQCTAGQAAAAPGVGQGSYWGGLPPLSSYCGGPLCLDVWEGGHIEAGHKWMPGIFDGGADHEWKSQVSIAFLCLRIDFCQTNQPENTIFGVEGVNPLCYLPSSGERLRNLPLRI